MKHLPSDKYTIAWFKLAEFVSRGEKEKALGIYKLLALSINDPAFVNKLEGDILYSFNDKSAEDKYFKAAVQYQKDERFIECAAIYENLITLNPECYDYLNRLLDIYKKINLKSKIIFTLKRLFEHNIKKNEIKKALELLENIEEISNDNSDLYEQITFVLIDQNFDSKITSQYIKKTIDSYFSENKKAYLQQFLSKLETSNKIYYNEALKQIKD